MQSRIPNKARIDETNSTFRDRVMNKLKLRSVPEEAKNCIWEDVYNKISSGDLYSNLLTATANQDICLASVLLAAGQVPDSDMIESAAAGDNAILRLYLKSTKGKITYQALLVAVDANKIDNTRTLLRDGRAPVDPPNAKPSLLEIAVTKNNLEMTELLLGETRIDPSGSDNRALYTAAYNNNVPLMRLLIENGANPNIEKSPFVAASVGNIEAVRYLLNDPNVNKKIIPLEYLRQAENNRNRDTTRPNVNKLLPPKSKATFREVAVLLNTTLYGDKIAGLFLGYYVATSRVDKNAVHALLTGSSVTSKFLRHVTLSSPTGAEAIAWLTSNFYDFSIDDRRDLVASAQSVEEDELRGNIPISAFSRIALGWSFQEIYEEVSRKKYDEEDIIMTALLLGGHLGFDKSLESGIEVPPESVLEQASQYTEDTNFSILMTMRR